MIVNTLGLEQPGRLSENLYLYSWLHRPQLRVKLWFPFACLQINWFLVEIDLDSEYMKPPLFFESHWVGVHTVTDPCVAYAHPAGALIWITGCLVCLSLNGKISPFTSIARIMNEVLDSAHNKLRGNSLNVGELFLLRFPTARSQKTFIMPCAPRQKLKSSNIRKKLNQYEKKINSYMFHNISNHIFSFLNGNSSGMCDLTSSITPISSWHTSPKWVITQLSYNPCMISSG